MKVTKKLNINILKKEFKSMTDIPYQLYKVDKYPKVVEVFKSHFESHTDVGASVTVIHKDEVILELSGGYSNYETKTPYNKDTLQIVFSSSKAVTLVVIAWLVDQGYLDYDCPVSKYWPEFAKGGKDKILIKDVMRHEAGIPWVEPPLEYEELTNPEKLYQRLADQAHVFEGKDTRCYHAAMQGFILNGIVTRTDPKQRTIGQILKEEFNDKLGTEFYYGIRDEEALKRNATWYTSPLSAWNPNEAASGPDPATVQANLMKAYPYIAKSMNLPLYRNSTVAQANHPDVHILEMPSGNGHTNSHSLAKIISQVISDKSIISEKTRHLMLEDPSTKVDEAAKIPSTLTKSGLIKFSYPDVNLEVYGGAGAGGSLVVFHPESQFTFAYVTNANQLTPPGFGRALDLLKAFYEEFKSSKQ